MQSLRGATEVVGPLHLRIRIGMRDRVQPNVGDDIDPSVGAFDIGRPREDPHANPGPNVVCSVGLQVPGYVPPPNSRRNLSPYSAKNLWITSALLVENRIHACADKRVRHERGPELAAIDGGGDDVEIHYMPGGVLSDVERSEGRSHFLDKCVSAGIRRAARDLAI